MKLSLKEVLFMNNKGQSLVTFVLILPLLVFFIAYFMDSASGMLEKNKLEGIIKNNLAVVLEKDIKNEQDIIYVIKENDQELNVRVNIIDDNIEITASKEKKSLFGHILNQKDENWNLKYCGNYLDKKIDKCEVGD